MTTTILNIHAIISIVAINNRCCLADNRENQRLNRAAGQLDNATADERSANAAYGAAQAGKYSAASNMLGSTAGLFAFDGL